VTQFHRTKCLILACGNTLRSDDGLGPWLAQWAEAKFLNNTNVRVQNRQQWTPDLSEEIAHAESVLFIDCSAESAPGEIKLIPIQPATPKDGLATHHSGAPELLALGLELFGSLPSQALMLTIGAGSTELGETFSDEVTAALADACRLIEATVLRFLS